MMKPSKQKKLEAKGWRVSSAADFLELSPEEEAYLEMKMALSLRFKEIRTRKRMSQTTVAKMLKSSQSRVAKMEAGDPSVSIDLLVRSLFILGESQNGLAKAIKPRSKANAA
jgi:predicted XRE-type DNA-binding protein